MSVTGTCHRLGGRGGQAAVAMAAQAVRRVWAGCCGEQGCTKAGREPVAPEPPESGVQAE